MKNVTLLLAAFLLTGISAVAQKTTIELNLFTELKVFDRVNVTLIKGTENKAIISGDNQQDVKITNDKGLLKIRMDTGDFLKGNKTSIELHYSEALDLVDGNEGAEILSTEPLDNTFLSLKAQEGAKLTLVLAVRNLNIKAISGGKIHVSGSSPNQEATVRSGGEYHAQDLIAKQTEVTVFAGGKAVVNSIEYVEANVTAGGTIEIYGDPDKVDENKKFGGSIILRKS